MPPVLRQQSADSGIAFLLCPAPIIETVKLLSLLYRLVFADALSGVDDDLDSFEDFFTSQEPVTDTAAQSMDDTANEVIDVWAS